MKKSLPKQEHDVDFFFEKGRFINNDVSYSKEKINSLSKKERTKYYAGKFVKYVNKLSQNKFIQSMMRGFMMVIPLLVVGGIFSLIQSVPGNFANMNWDGVSEKWAEPIWLTRLCQKVFNLTYGIAGILACLTITYEMTRFINMELRESKQIYPIVTVVAAFSCYMIFMVGNVYADGQAVNFSSIGTNILGTLGMLPGLLIAFFVPYIYKWCYKFNAVIRLPKVVPEAVLLTVIVLIPLFISVIVYLVPSYLVLEFTDKGIFDWMNEKALGHVYEASNTFGFYAGYQELCALCYFTGIHNSVISNIFESVRQVNVANNASIALAGGTPTDIYVGATATNMVGGLGGLAMVPYAILLFTKSKQMKQIGYIALIASFFNLPEPILFGMPVILNPVLLAPMLVAPFLLAGCEWIFVHNLGMMAPYIDVAWCVPWLFVLPMGTGVDPISFGAMAACLAISFVVWSPFVIIQDRILLKGQKAANIAGEDDGKWHDDRIGIQYLWDAIAHRKKHLEYKQKNKQAKIEQKAELAKIQLQKYHQLMIEKQALAKFQVTKLNPNIIQNNVLVVSATEERAKALARTIIAGLEYNSDLVLFIKAMGSEKLRPIEKTARHAQLVIIDESAAKIYEDIEIITNLTNHVIYPITNDEYDALVSSPKNMIDLVDSLTVQKAE